MGFYVLYNFDLGARIAPSPGCCKDITLLSGYWICPQVIVYGQLLGVRHNKVYDRQQLTVYASVISSSPIPQPSQC